MPTQTKTRVARSPRLADGTGALERRLVTVVIGLLAVALAAAATRGPIVAVLAVLVAGGVAMLAVLGRERVAMVVLMCAFATSPMYKGIAPGGASTPVTPTDLLLVLAIMLLVPTLVGLPLRLPPTYTVGISVILVTGTLSTVFSPSPVGSILQFVQWLVVILALIVLFAW